MSYVPTVYIAGPMTGLPDYNYPAFNSAARRMRDFDWNVINPAENHDGNQALPHEEYMKTDIPQVATADALLVLKGWEASRGASLEVAVADACGLRLLSHTQRPQEALLGDDRGIVDIRPTEQIRNEWRKWPNAIRGEGTINASGNGINPPSRLETAPQRTDPFGDELDAIRKLHDAKKADYTGGKHPLANYKNAGESIGVSAGQAMFSRLNEKVFRAKELLASGTAPQVTNESLADTFRDIAIISILIKIWLDPESGWGG